jgi:hypothetical protein
MSQGDPTEPPIDARATQPEQQPDPQPQAAGAEADVAQPSPPKQRRAALVAAIVAGAALLLCGGGATAAYLYLADADQPGAASPSTAVEDFLDAVYRAQDVAQAKRLICAQARDEDELTKKIDEVKAYREAHEDPQFTWAEPTVTQEDSETATAEVTVRVTTRDEKVAEQSLRFTVIKKNGWLVCEVEPAQ